MLDPVLPIQRPPLKPTRPFAASDGTPLADVTVLDYWRWMIDVNLDTISQIITVKVRAFTREDAVRVAEGVLTFSEELINNLSESSRFKFLGAT